MATAEVARPHLPGPYPVGHRTVRLTDPERADRPVTADLWYPAQADAGDAPRTSYELLPGVGYDSAVAAADVDPATDGPFPLVVYSHGGGGLRFLAARLTEVLASHGFVVAAPDHAGNTAVDVVLGTEAPLDQVAIDRPADVAFVVDAMLDGELGPGVSDPERVGIVGHSFGGFTALAAVSGRGPVPPDPRVGAVVTHAPWTWAPRGMEIEPGPLFADEALARVAVPVLVISGTADQTLPPPTHTDPLWRALTGGPAYRVDITAAGHQSFTDVGLYQRMLADRPDFPPEIVAMVEAFAADATGPDLIDLDLAHRIIDGTTVAFLLRHLAGEDSEMADVATAAAVGGRAVTVDQRL